MITLGRLMVAHYKGIASLDLTFPERGSFLIEGRNEAGKSTLFDAVHFALYGVPMVGDQASALHYGADEMEVRLQLAVSGTQLAVRRRTRQTAKTLRSEAELSVVRPGEGAGDEETVRGAAAVSQRLQAELGGLTAEALLNSCLVAQKQLGRLETLSRASREEALTILLNLGKLSDVQGRLKPRPQDDVLLGAARARVALAQATGELAVLAEERHSLEGQRRLVRLRAGLAQLDALKATGAAAGAALQEHNERLAALRAALAGIEQAQATRARWQRVQDVAQQMAVASREHAELERRATEARRASATLPRVQAALARHQTARTQVEALVGQQARLKELAQERERIAARLQERERLAAHNARLTTELDRRRRERRDVARQLNSLAPLLTEQQEMAARLAALQDLQQRLGGLGELRHALEDLQSQVAERAEAEARQREAEATLAAARATLATQETLRRQRELAKALRRWCEACQVAGAAARARRLLADLALAVAGVEHVAVRPEAGPPEGQEAGETAGLRLSLLVDHPLTGAQVVRLRLWAGGAELIEARPASEAEATGLQVGNLPLLSAAGDGAPVAELQEATAELTACGEPVPADIAGAQRRLAAVELALAAAAQGAPDDPQSADHRYVQARAEVIAAAARLKEAAATRAGLPDVATLQRHVATAQRTLLAAEQGCLTAAQGLGLPAEGLPEAIRRANAAAQRRFGELAEATGKRTSLQARLVDLDRTGGEWLRQLEECRQDLASDTDVALRARLEVLGAEEAAVVAEMARLYAAVVPVAAIPATTAPAAATPRSSAVARAPGTVLSAPAAGLALALTPAPAVSWDADQAHHSGAGSGFSCEVVPGGDSSRADGVALLAGPEGADVVALRQRLQEGCDVLQGEVAVLERQAAALEEVEAGLQGAGERLAELGAALARALSEVSSLTSDVWGLTSPDAPLHGEATTAPGQRICEEPAARLHGEAVEGGHREDPEAVLALAQRRLGAIEAELAALDEPAVRAAEQETQRAVWSAEDGLMRTVEEGWRLAGDLLSLAGLALQEAAAGAAGGARDLHGLVELAARLREACPETSAHLPSLDETERALDGLRQREWDLMRTVQEARLLLGDEAPPTPAQATAALAELELDLAARRRAQDILGQTRQRMINKVLPDTMRNMCLLLPLLTAERYRYAELTPDYRLQVWDERKRGYVEKNLYSGGTQDQFSLALRLGFALAALPRELGTSPGFLFLDEPLSSFDRDRTASLIDLLTHGQIATFFQQVFLISHSQAFDPSLFTHHIVMENGAVALSTLPAAAS